MKRIRLAAAWGLCCVTLGGPSAVAGELSATPSGEAAPSTSPEAPAPSAPPGARVGMDRLLRLPDSYRVEDARRAGASPAEWRARFGKAREALEQANASLEQARRELEELAGESSNWQVAAPGGAAAVSENSTVSYRLVQEIRRRREDVARAEQQLTELDVEANLAGVPQDWRY